MKFQASYNTKEEERSEGQSAYPDLSLLRTVLFWDTDIHKIDWKQQKLAVIRQVFERGDEQEKEEIRRFNGEDEATAALSGSNHG